MEKKTEFLNIYFNLPLEERKNVVVVLDEEPITWNLAYQEVRNHTKKGQVILNKLKELDIL